MRKWEISGRSRWYKKWTNEVPKRSRFHVDENIYCRLIQMSNVYIYKEQCVLYTRKLKNSQQFNALSWQALLYTVQYSSLVIIHYYSFLISVSFLLLIPHLSYLSLALNSSSLSCPHLRVSLMRLLPHHNLALTPSFLSCSSTVIYLFCGYSVIFPVSCS